MNETSQDSGRPNPWDRHAWRAHMREPRVHPYGRTGQLAMGIFLMTMGALLTLDRLDLVDTSGVLRLWPLGLIALGGTLLVQRQDSHGRFWGFGWLALGSWLLLNTFGILRVGFWDLFWPLLLVFIGTRLIVRGRARSAASTSTDAPAAGGPHLFAMLGGSTRTIQNEVFRGATMTALMGGCVLDLRQAIIPPGEEAVIDVFVAMGSHEIFVPSAWTVAVDATPILGGVEDKRLPAIPNATAGEAPAPRLVVRGMVLMGGLTLKN